MKNEKLVNPKVGALVVMNSLDDAAVFRITGIIGFSVSVIDVSVENSAEQYTDTSLLLKPNAKQIYNVQ